MKVTMQGCQVRIEVESTTIVTPLSDFCDVVRIVLQGALNGLDDPRHGLVMDIANASIEISDLANSDGTLRVTNYVLGALPDYGDDDDIDAIDEDDIMANYHRDMEAAHAAAQAQSDAELLAEEEVLIIDTDPDVMR